MDEHQRWTQSNITELRNALKDGNTFAEAAVILDRPEEAIVEIAGRLRLRIQGNEVSMRPTWTRQSDR